MTGFDVGLCHVFNHVWPTSSLIGQSCHSGGGLGSQCTCMTSWRLETGRPCWQSWDYLMESAIIMIRWATRVGTAPGGLGRWPWAWLQGEETTGNFAHGVPLDEGCCPSLDWFYRLNFVFLFVCLWVGNCMWMQVLAEARRGHQIPHNWSYRELFHPSWVLEGNPGPPEE